jgi:hypothetical protein
MPPGLLLLERPEILAPVVFLLGFVFGFAGRASISRRRRWRARSSYRSDAVAASSWRLQPPPAKAVLAQADRERLQDIADAPKISEQTNGAMLAERAGQIH